MSVARKGFLSGLMAARKLLLSGMAARKLLLFGMLAAGCFASQARVITGLVLSESDSTAIVGAVCRLSVDSAVIVSSVTDDKGSFRLATAKDEKHQAIVSVKMIGYAPAEIVIPSNDHDLNIGTVYLSEGIALGEVEVTHQTFTDSRGRTIVYPSPSEVKASPTAVSLFQKLPLAGLEANPINHSISVDGGSPVILINGVPSTLSDFNALHPKDIERVEYSRFTPARYADKGNSGYLNIILKKRTDGGSIFAWLRDCPFTGFLDGQLQSSYHQGPSQFTLRYDGSWRCYSRCFDTASSSYIAPDFRVDLLENSRTPFYYQSHNVSFKYLYQPKTTTYFSATFNAGIMEHQSTGHKTTNDSFMGDYKTESHTKSNSSTPSLDLFMHHEFGGNNTLEAQVVGTLSSDDYRRSYLYLYPSGDDTDYIMDADNRRRSLISEVSYSRQFDFNGSLSAGYQNTISRSTNLYLDNNYKPVLTENNNYVYLQYGQQIRKVYISLSTGMKMFWVKNDLNKRHFIRNLSSAQVNWNVSDRWSLYGNFSYRPSIPGLSSLTDYPQQTTPYIISNGNPDLKVAEYFNYAVGTNFNYKKIRGGLGAQYFRINNPWQSYVRYLGDRMFMNQSLNFDHQQNFLLSANINIPDFHGFGFNGKIFLEHDSSRGAGWSEELTSLSGSINLWWSKGPFTISYYRKFPGKNLYGTRVSKEENSDMLQFQYRPDKHWTLAASWMYMFETAGTKYYRWDYSPANPGTSCRHISSNANMAVFTVSYSADFGSIFRTGRRGLHNSDNGSSLLKL